MGLKDMGKKLSNMTGKALNFLKRLPRLLLSFTVRWAMIMVCFVAASYVTLKLPAMHDRYLRTAVGSKVYMIRGGMDTGGGTGFAMKGPSGQNYILTNDHVCGVSKDGYHVLVSGDEGHMWRRIIAHDENSDLCLIEGLPGVQGLQMAQEAPMLGDEINVVGHPLLMPKHLAKGEMIGVEDVSILMGPISIVNPENGKEEFIPKNEGGISPDECRMNKHSQQIINYDMLFFVIPIKFCVMTVKDSYNTALTIHPGNSGSPVVNFWGEVIGVVFAADSRTNWGRMVSLKDVRTFLKNY